MKVILLVTTRHDLMNGRIFETNAGYIRSYEAAKPVIRLREEFEKLGYLVKTLDSPDEMNSAQAIIFFDYNQKNPYYQEAIKRQLESKMYLVVCEPPSVLPEDHDRRFHDHFKKILTFNKELIDNKKYFEWNYTIPINSGEKIAIPRSPFEDKKLLTLVSGNKFSPYHSELYGERVRAIKFMEKYHPNEFDLYGIGWESPMIHSRLASALKINGAIFRFWPKNWKIKQFATYRGKLKEKNGVLDKYKFVISYENDITKGWVSEKIIETMLYGGVPIYLGDPEIEKRIPKECFVDKREFATYESLYKYISEIEENEHTRYLDSIEKFLNSKGVYPFTIDAYVESYRKMLGI